MNSFKFASLCILLSCILFETCTIKKNPDLPDIGKFMVAVKDNDLDSVKYYLKHFNYMANVMLGDGPFGVGGVHMNPIMFAAAFNTQGTEIFDLLIKYDGHLDYVNEYGMNALSYASQRNNVIAIEYLIKKGMDVNFADSEGATCLMAAVCLKSFDAAKLLLENGARIDIVSKINESSVYNVIPYLPEMDSETLLELLNLFLQYDSEMLDVPTKDGYTSFAFAVLNGHYETIDFYLEHGASASKVLNFVNENLDYILLPEHNEYLIKLLENVKEPLNGVNEDGDTLLMRAILSQKLDFGTIKSIAEKSENIEHENSLGTTALIVAAAENRADVVKLLLEMGADKNHRTKEGDTAIELHKYFQKEKGEPANQTILELLH